MNNQEYMANIEFTIDWETEHARHTDKYYAFRVNFWRDCFPPDLYDKLMQVGPNDRIEYDPAGGRIVGPYREKDVFSIRPSQFGLSGKTETPVVPQTGRYYPKGLLKGIAHVFPGNVQPFRIHGVDKDRIVVDFNHPLAGKDVNLSLQVQEMWKKDREKGGTCYDWLETVADGPGMQDRINGAATDFSMQGAYSRVDETPDTVFYRDPRMVSHVDQTARRNIRKLHGTLVRPDMKVLDLMASWDSHVGFDFQGGEMIGLGLNPEELAANPKLSGYHVQDLNESASLPFDHRTFDAVICTNSVEYLTDPAAVFQAVGQVLKPGGIFVVTFSNRWFPPKVTRLWTELHEFERMGLVSEYFLESPLFGDVQTFSMRGFPRPVDDRYFPEFKQSDPVYSVWARRI